MEHYRKLEHMYDAAPINHWFKPELRVSEGAAELRLPLREDFHHAAAAVHGAVYFKALDDATYFAVNSLVPDHFVLTARFEIDLLKPVSLGALVAKAKVTGEDERRIYATGELFNEQGELLAVGKGAFARSKIALTPDVHYR